MTPSSRYQLSATLRLIIPILVVLTVLVGAGAVFYTRSQALMAAEISSKLKTSAAVASLYFNGDDLDEIVERSQIYTDGYKALVDQLRAVVSVVPDTRYAYLMRRTSDPMELEFIADSDSLLTPKELDADGDGVLQEDEEPSLPGDSYDISEVPALQFEAFAGPAVDADFTVDQWGTFISAYAPVRRSDGTIAAVLGLDMDAADYMRLSERVFSPLALLLSVAGLCALAAVVLYTLRQRQREMHQHMEELRTGLLQLAFHQLGAPLTAFQWSLEILREHQAGRVTDDVISEHMLVLEDGIVFMRHLLNDLQQADRVSAGNLKYAAVPTDLRTLITGVAAEFEARAEHSAKPIKLELEGDLTIGLDPGLISGVLRELIDNALLFTPDSKPIVIRAKRDSHGVRVDVVDQGCGIDASEFDRIFQQFGRASNATKFHPKGSGLGLYIARGIVEKAGGEISVQSAEGRGSTFSFHLPIFV